MRSVVDPPPATPIEPVTEVLHGVEITDPYRWLEDQKSPRTRKWIEEQTAYTRAYFDAIPNRERIRKRVQELLAVETISEPWKVGNRYFFLRREPHQEQPCIMMREGETGPDNVLVDPASTSGTSTAMSIYGISKSGRLLAYGLRQSGEDASSVHVIDVDTRTALPDCLPTGMCRGLAFSRDGDGFYYVNEPVGKPLPHTPGVYWHALGTNQDDDVLLFSVGDNPSLKYGLLSSANSRFLVYVVARLQDPPVSDYYIHDLAKRNPPRRLLAEESRIFSPVFSGDRLIALTDRAAPNFRIVEIDLGRPEPEHWRDLIPESSARIQDFEVTENCIFFAYVADLETRIETFDLVTRQRSLLPCPPHGTASFLSSESSSDTLFYEFTSFSDPTSIFCVQPRNGGHDVFARKGRDLSLPALDVEQVQYESIDGTRVPMFLVSKRGYRRSGSLPTFLTGYGGFGVSITPRFTAYATFLLERGCLFAIANIRGGSERGEEWHLAGKRHNRQNAFDDFIAAAEWLLSRGVTAPDRLAIGGGSNAGLLVAAALTQRPHLFRAVLCLGPLTDMLRYHLFDSANLWIDEFGSADGAHDFESLRRYSPYHRVEPGTYYPAILFISGDADTRCNAMHSRKLAARLQAATKGRHPILLDYKPAWGHSPVQPLTARIDALTDRLAFLCHELALTV